MFFPMKKAEALVLDLKEKIWVKRWLWSKATRTPPELSVVGASRENKGEREIQVNG